MATGVHELVWVAVLLDSCPDVQVLGVRVDATTLGLGYEWVPLTVLDVHANSQADAQALALALGLREVPARRKVTESERYGASEWRVWSGWVADASRESAVLVEVTGADRLPQREPADLGPGGEFGVGAVA